MKNALVLLGLLFLGMCSTPSQVASTSGSPTPVMSPSLSGGHYMLQLDYDDSKLGDDAQVQMERLESFTVFLLPKEYTEENRSLVSGTHATAEEAELTLTASKSWGGWRGELNVPDAQVELELTSIEDPFTGEFSADVGGERVRGTYRLVIGW